LSVYNNSTLATALYHLLGKPIFLHQRPLHLWGCWTRNEK